MARADVIEKGQADGSLYITSSNTPISMIQPGSTGVAIVHESRWDGYSRLACEDISRCAKGVCDVPEESFARVLVARNEARAQPPGCDRLHELIEALDNLLDCWPFRRIGAGHFVDQRRKELRLKVSLDTYRLAVLTTEQKLHGPG